MLFKNLKIIGIVSVVGVILAYLISKKVGAQFERILEYIGFILILIGALSVEGNMKINSNYNYKMSKLKTKDGFVDMEFGTYKFAIVCGLSGMLFLLISLTVWKYSL